MNNTEIKKMLFHPRTNKNYFLAQLKADSDYSSFKRKIAAINQHPFGKQALLSYPLPKSFSQLRQSNIIPHSANIESEIAWLMHSILENAESINQFVIYKKRFENEYLLNDYENAEKTLNLIEKEISISNWGAENRLLLVQEKSGTESNWLLLDEYSKVIKDPLSLFLIEQSSKKAESNFSYIRYKANFENIINGTSEYLHEYLCFKAIYPAYTGFQNYSFFINVESVSSVIDRYLLLIDVIIELLPRGENEFLLQVTNELNERITNDLRLKQISNILSEKFIEFSGKEEITNFIDNYSIGNYEMCINNASYLIRKFPSSIELCVIYIKSLIESNETYKPLKVSDSIEEILLKLYDVFTLNDNFNSSLEDLLKISLKCFSFNWGKQLFGVISEHAKLNDELHVHQFYHLINSEINNSKILNYIHVLGDEKSKRVFNFYREINAISTRINLYINEADFSSIQRAGEISKSRRELYFAKALMKQNEIKRLIKHLESASNDNRKSIVTKRDMLELQFNAYLSENKLEKALTLYVDSFFKNRNLLSRLDNERLLQSLIKNSKPLKNIDITIFYFITSLDIYEQYVKYDEYMEFRGVERPTQLIDESIIPNDKMIFFLKEICNVEIMHHSLYFEGTDDIENERINTLKYLLFIDKINEAEYIKEISEITQKTKIRKAIREVNKGRITINTQQLKNKEENNIKDNFLRYKELVVFSNTHNLKTLDPTSKMLNEYFNSLEDKSIREKVVSVNDPAFISFKSMFIDLRDKFILSKDFGLDGYLSTRIRHGTFLNHIRSIFESFNLVSQKRNNEYIQNEFWIDKTPDSVQDKKDEIQAAIKVFSRQIDEFTEFIIKECIQIKTEKHILNPNAFFDFTLSDTTLAYLFKDSKDRITTHSSFLDYVFDNLEALIDIRLKEIRSYFHQNIKESYTKIIDEFDNNVRLILGNCSFVDLTSSIVKCKTNIQNELDNIAEWFNVSNPTTDNLLDFETIIKTAVEITNTIYPQNQINPKIIVDNDIHFIGGINVIYLIRILLDNIIKHSKIQDTNYESKIEVEISDLNTLKLSVSNKINENYSAEIISRLTFAKEKWSNKDDFSKSNIEGGSGLDKIRRILSVDMKMINYGFDYKLEKDILTIFIIMEIQIYQTETN